MEEKNDQLIEKLGELFFINEKYRSRCIQNRLKKSLRKWLKFNQSDKWLWSCSHFLPRIKRDLLLVLETDFTLEFLLLEPFWFCSPWIKEEEAWKHAFGNCFSNLNNSEKSNTPTNEQIYMHNQNNRIKGTFPNENLTSNYSSNLA